MATMSATPATHSPAAFSGSNSGEATSLRTGSSTVRYIGGFNSYGGLRAHCRVASLALPVCAEECFAKIASSLIGISPAAIGGGALSSTCSAAAEIFRVASILPGLVLVGVAVGFVLLRIEGYVEETE